MAGSPDTRTHVSVALRLELSYGVICTFGTPWLDHFDPPIGTGNFCVRCAQLADGYDPELKLDYSTRTDPKPHRRSTAATGRPQGQGPVVNYPPEEAS